MHTGGSHAHMSSYPHDQTRVHTDTHHNFPCTKDIYINNKNKYCTNSQRVQSDMKSVQHQMPCLPTLWQPTQLLCVQPPTHTSHTCFMNWPANVWSEKYFLLQLKTNLTAMGEIVRGMCNINHQPGVKTNAGPLWRGRNNWPKPAIVPFTSGPTLVLSRI